MKYIGIDIGLDGGIAVLDDVVPLVLYKIPLVAKGEIDYVSLYNLLQFIQSAELSNSGSNPHLLFEKLGVIFGSSKSTAFSMGYQSGAIEMMAIALGIPYTKVSAKTWQKQLFTGVDVIKKASGANNTKAMASIVAKRLFPSANFKATSKSKKDDDGLIDAILIAEYGRRNNL